jgi:hypothetical protein
LERLTKIRQARKLTQKQLAKKLNVDQTTISAYEKGRGLPNSDMLIKLSKELHISADYLIGLSDFPGIPEIGTPNYIPIYRSVLDGIGQGEPLGYEVIPISAVSKDRSFIGIQIQDDSMFPLYLPGDIILVEKSARIRKGMYGLFTIELDGHRENVLRQYFSTPSEIILRATKIDIEPLIFTHAECKRHCVSLVGPVFQLIRRTELEY